MMSIRLPSSRQIDADEKLIIVLVIDEKRADEI